MSDFHKDNYSRNHSRGQRCLILNWFKEIIIKIKKKTIRIIFQNFFKIKIKYLCFPNLKYGLFDT